MEPNTITVGMRVYYEGEPATAGQFDGGAVLIERDAGDDLYVMPEHLESVADRSVTEINGVGETTAEKLASRGIETVGDVYQGAVQDLYAGGLELTRAERVYHNAGVLVGDVEPEPEEPAEEDPGEDEEPETRGESEGDVDVDVDESGETDEE